jgi:glycine dehydrogenase
VNVGDGWGIEVEVGDPVTFQFGDDVFAVLLHYPATDGAVRDPAGAHAAGALRIVAADTLPLMMLRAPGELGADVVVGSTQRYGMPIGFGGPHAASMPLATSTGACSPAA